MPKFKVCATVHFLSTGLTLFGIIIMVGSMPTILLPCHQSYIFHLQYALNISYPGVSRSTKSIIIRIVHFQSWEIISFLLPPWMRFALVGYYQVLAMKTTRKTSKFCLKIVTYRPERRCGCRSSSTFK